MKARVEAAEKGYYDARAAAPDVDVWGANETLTLVREEIAAKKTALKSMAVDAPLGGDISVVPVRPGVARRIYGRGWRDDEGEE